MKKLIASFALALTFSCSYAAAPVLIGDVSFDGQTNLYTYTLTLPLMLSLGAQPVPLFIGIATDSIGDNSAWTSDIIAASIRVNAAKIDFKMDFALGARSAASAKSGFEIDIDQIAETGFAQFGRGGASSLLRKVTWVILG